MGDTSFLLHALSVKSSTDNTTARPRPTEARAKLRLEIRARRRAIPEREQRHHARQLARGFTRSRLFLQCRSLATYLANDGEIDPGPLVTRIRHAGKRVYLPVLRPRPSRALWFSEHRSGDHLQPNRFGIREPDIRRCPPVPAWSLGLILMPLVAFDEQGNRLGMGGGFYDRTLAYLRQREQWRRPLLIGLAHECQKVPSLESQRWDIPLDAIFTEAAVYSWQLPPQANRR